MIEHLDIIFIHLETGLNHICRAYGGFSISLRKSYQGSEKKKKKHTTATLKELQTEKNRNNVGYNSISKENINIENTHIHNSVRLPSGHTFCFIFSPITEELETEKSHFSRSLPAVSMPMRSTFMIQIQKAEEQLKLLWLLQD